MAEVAAKALRDVLPLRDTEKEGLCDGTIDEWIRSRVRSFGVIWIRIHSEHGASKEPMNPL